MSDYGYFAAGGRAPPSRRRMSRGCRSGAATAGALQPRAHTGSAPVSYPTVGRFGFGASLRSGFQLMPTCWSVLAGEPALLLVPLVVLVVTIGILLGYAELLGGLGQVVSNNKYSTAVRVFPVLR